MSLTASEEALVRQLLDQQAAILSLAGNEATITSKLGATKVTLADLVAASSLAGADLLLTRQGTTDKSVRADILAAYMGAELGALFAPIANPTFTGNPKAPTAAQFDNDTSLATTAFVQRALGNTQGYATFTANGSLTAADVGKSVTLSSATPFTVTLPLVGAVPIGSCFYFKNFNGGTVTVQRAGGDVLFISNQSLASFPIAYGESAIVISMNGSWAVIYADATIKYNGQFSASLAADGYQKLPSGLIIQWGYVTNAGTSGPTITFPITFPNGCLCMTSGDEGSTPYAKSFASVTNANFRFYSTQTADTSYWMAIGY